MKRLRYLFTCFLALAGLGVAQADGQYEQGTEVTDIAAVAEAGTQVLLQSPGTASYSAGKYLSPTGMTETISASCLYKFEATGEEVDGYPTYRLINVEKGQYLRYEDYSAYYDSSDKVGEGHGYTSDASQAYVFTALHPIAGSTDGRTKVDEERSTLVEDAWILACDKTVTSLEGTGTGYFGYIGVGFFSMYSDTNQWMVYEANELGGADKLAAYIQSAFPNGLTLYAEGNTVGHLPSDLYQALTAAYNAALELANSSTATEAECDAASETLAAAKEAADAGIIGLQDGKYYFFQCQRDGTPWVYANTSGLHATNSSSYTPPTDASKASISDAAYIWKAVAATDGQFYLYNLGTATYAGQNETTSDQIPCTAQPTAALTVEYNTTNELAKPSLFNIYNDVNMYHIDASLNMVKWQAKDGTGCLFYFQDCDDAIIEALASTVEQNRLNNNLSALYLTASSTYNKGRAYTSDTATPDGNFDEPGLVGDVTALSSNAQEASEGSLDALLDGDFTTYFHSMWASNNENIPSTYHYIQADLGEALQTFVIKYAKRHNNQTTYNPTQILVYGTNDVNGTWSLCGAYPLTYAYTANVNETETANFVGIRGIEMDQAYRYVRIAVTEHQMDGGTLNGFPYFYLSELHFYPATYDASSSTFEQVEATVSAALADALKAAASELTTETATQATIDALQTAYDNFIAQFPDPQTLEDAIASAQEYADSYPVGEEMGYYTQDAKTNLETVIAAVQATVSDVMTLAQIQDGVSKLTEAVNAFKGSLILPEAGKAYILRGMTTDENNTRALNAIIYSTGNATDSHLKSIAQENGADVIDPAGALNYVWKVESIGNGKIVLRNLGTGFYMSTQSSLNGAISNVAEKTEIGIQGISTGGGFNLVVGDELYVNFQGQGENMVAWNSASGTDNSSISFEEVEDLTYGQTEWPVSANVMQILTLPIGILSPTADEGDAYTVLGQKETDGKYTVELKALDEGTELPAGTPFVFKPATDKTSITLVLTDEDELNMNYATEGLTTSDGLLTGVIAAKTVEGNSKLLLKNGMPYILGNDTDDDTRVAWANSGYINYAETTETGDAQITLTESMTTSIAAATLTKAGETVDVYTVAGVRLRSNVKAGNATNGLPAGLYIVGGQKVLVK